ncbi:MAG: response regulator [Clostridiales bacterium]|jgi:two-component system response regulator YesN|nr:response regulator [Clostridiales bacterium]
MNILLVDDDKYVLEALRQSLQWEALGIENVYVAQSVSKAKKIFSDIQVHVLVSDIEMPKEDGFELLKWIRQENHICSVLLLTSYAEFRYATEAIKYNCLGYALKPVNYEELGKMIRTALAEERKALSFINHEKYSEYWTKSEKYRKERFFFNILSGSQTEESDPDIDIIQDTFLPVAIVISDMPGDSRFSYAMLEWTVKNAIAENLKGEGFKTEASFRAENNLFLAIVKIENIKNKDLFSSRSIVTAAEAFVAKAARRLNLRLAITLGTPVCLSGLKMDAELFLACVKTSPVDPAKVSVLQTYNHADISPVETIKRYICSNLDECMTRETLAEIVHLNADYLARLFKKETDESILNYITRKRIEKAKEYLLNTSESISNISQKVGIDNFSYFTKVFKDITGVTPKEFRRNGK